MIKYVCSDTEYGPGQMTIAYTAQEAFEEYKNYWDSNVNIEDVYIYRIDTELKGKAQYVFETVGT